MGEMITSLKEQGKAVLVMMGIAIIAVLAMIVLDAFSLIVQGLPGLGFGNGTSPGSTNVTVQAFITLFITAFGIVGSFASITMLIIVVKVIIGVVRGLKT